MKSVVLVTGSSSGFGKTVALTAAKKGHIVYASMRDVAGRNATAAGEIDSVGKEDGLDLRSLELDVQSQASTCAAVEALMKRSGRIDVVVHNAGHLVTGAAEAFSAEEMTRVFDINVVGTQRVNRAILPI